MVFVDLRFSISVSIPYESLVEMEVYDRGDEPALGLYRETKLSPEEDEIDPRELVSPSEPDIEFKFEIPSSEAHEYESSVEDLLEEHKNKQEITTQDLDEEDLDPRKDTIYRIQAYGPDVDDYWARCSLDDLLDTGFIGDYTELRAKAFKNAINTVD